VSLTISKFHLPQVKVTVSLTTGKFHLPQVKVTVGEFLRLPLPEGDETYL
jgi:hypothetical protein